MEAYPRTLRDFESDFGTEEKCREYLAQLRWPQGFQCFRCGGRKAWGVGVGRRECAACGYQASVTAGTIFHGSHQPLTTWFRAMWWVTNQKTGASALGLHRLLGFGSYRTAWLMLHKLRRAMVRPERDRLTGRVEVDETYVGAPEKGRHGRRIGEKALVVVAAQEDGNGIGRIRMKRVPNGKAENLHSFIQDAVEVGAIVHTDAWQGYAGIEVKGYRHEVTELVHTDDDENMLPRVHRVVSLLKRWLMGTHQGAVSHQHLDYYLDEFTFRFNRRTSQSRGKLFYRLVQQAVRIPPTSYTRVCQHVRVPRRNP